ncbi:ATP-dependent DNA ligase Cdc17, partial [Coemansia sp. RSA 2618]
TGLSDEASKEATIEPPRRKLRKRRAVISDDEESDASTHLSSEDAQKDNNSSSSELEVSVAAAKVAKTLSLKPQAKKIKTNIASVVVEKTTIATINTKEGRQVPFLALCTVFAKIEATTKRLEITALCRDFLAQVMAIGQRQLVCVVMLCLTKIAPDHEGIELGIGESILIKSIASATGRQVARVKQEHQELGDLGTVVMRGKSNQRTMFKPKPLDVAKVFATFREIAMTSGANSIQKKSALITGLLASCSEVEAKYLIRSLEGRLRIGLAESTVQTALAQAALSYEQRGEDELEAGELQKATEHLKQVLSEFPMYDRVIASIYEHGISDIANHCMLTPTLPVKPMLAKIEKAADDILRRFEDRPFTCEYKYDGERSQIHFVREE